MAECKDGLKWAFEILGECIRSTRDKVSIAFGVLAIATWFMFGFPQMVTNCIKKMPDEAVSPYLLLFWLLGDTLNLIGAFLTNQLFLQKVLAGYTVVIDLILIFQTLYYYCLHKKKLNAVETLFEEKLDESSDKVSSTVKKSGRALYSTLIGIFGLTILWEYGGMLEIGQAVTGDSSNFQGRRLLQVQSTAAPADTFLSKTEAKIGYTIGWIATVMYFCSRIPQIVQNFKRKSTEGLSLYLFILAIFGNIFYGLQIFIKSDDPIHLLTSLPWIVGSIGILLFDIIIIFQFVIYRNNIRLDDYRDNESAKEL